MFFDIVGITIVIVYPSNPSGGIIIYIIFISTITITIIVVVVVTYLSQWDNS